MKTMNDENRLDLNDVKRAVYSWSIRFREAGYANEQLARISHEYHEDLVSEHVTTDEFEDAARAVRKRCRFFPKMVDLLAAVEDRRRQQPAAPTASSAIQIEAVTSHHDLTEEEIRRNKRRIQAITDMLAGKIKMDDAIDVIRNSEIEEFRKR